MNEKRINKSIQKHERNIERLSKQQNGMFVNESKKQQLQNKIDKEKYMISLYVDFKNGDESAADKLHQAFIDDSAFTKIGNNMERAGESIKSTGKGIAKAGLHVTGATYAPPIYLGYQAIKQSRKKPKNKTIEQDLIELINDVEKAEKKGEINEEQKRGYIIDFVDNYYKK